MFAEKTKNATVYQHLGRSSSEHLESEAELIHEAAEQGHLPTRSPSSRVKGAGTYAAEGFTRFRDRFTRKGRKNIGIAQSLKKIALHHWLNAFVIFIPLAWVAHFLHWAHRLQYIFSFLAIIPLEKLLEYGGEQMCFYVGKTLGDLIVVSLSNTVEATLAIILLMKCELRLLQSTIIGVVVLHLLLVPGMSFLADGTRIASQDLHPHHTELNQVLLTTGVLALLLPAAFFSALNRGTSNVAEGVLSDEIRTTFLQMSRGIAIILLFIYIFSRIFLHNPPGDAKPMQVHPDAPKEYHEQEKFFLESDPEVNQYVCIIVLVVAIAIMAATAEWLVESIEDVREQGSISEEWFGLVLLPIVSWSADGAASGGFLIKLLINLILNKPTEPEALAKAGAIDISIQFTLFWMPFIILLSWWTDRSLNLLFDTFEVALLLGTCFLVNYITADAKTNWAEGLVMVSFYVMIALCAWFYTGQPDIHELLGDCGHVVEAVVESAANAVTGH